jgi:hypothetical protein
VTAPNGGTHVSWGALRKMADDATKPLPIDWYEVAVVKAEAKVYGTGSHGIAAVLEVQSGPHKTRRLFTNFVLVPENGFALGIFFRNMGAFGLDEKFFADLQQYPLEQGLELIAQALVGRGVKVKVGIRQWQGQDRNECTEFAALAGSGPVAPGMITGPASMAGGPSTGPVTSPTPSGPLTPGGFTPSGPASPVPGPPPPPEPAF